MKKNVISELVLYRYRYAIGYGLFTIALISLLVIAGIFLPGSLTDAEMQSATSSSSFPLADITAWAIVDLPYHLLQKASIALFGLTPLAIKLPSLILALLTGVGFLLLLRRWFKQNVAVLAAIIAVTASQFLVVAQSGTATIMLLFWPTMLLLAATYVSLNAKRSLWWKLLFFAAAALSLYTPLSVYVLIAMLVAVVLHPHLRFMLLRLSRIKLAACLLLSTVLLIPLVWHLIQSPSISLTLLGLPSEFPSWGMILGNIQYIVHALFGFTHPEMRDNVLLPLYGLSAAALMILGALQLIVDRHSARTYTIGLWMLLLGVLLVLQPQFIAIIFIPMLLMLAIGIDTLIGKWYGLFPKNPYARIAALLPLAVLLGGIVFTGIDRYTGTYRYSPSVAEYYNNDLSLIRTELAKEDAPSVLVVNEDQHAFYSVLVKKNPDLTVTHEMPANRTPALIDHDLMTDRTLQQYGEPSRLITDSTRNDSLRFYLYKQ